MIGAKSEQRLIGVDLLRALSILAVLLVHWQLCVPIAPPLSWIDRLTLAISFRGNYGVTLFFVISGFLIMRNVMLREPDIYRLSLRAFYVRRIARIQPLMLASIAFGALMLALTGHSAVFRWGAPFTASFWISLFTFTFNWVRVFHGGPVRGWGLHWDVMWSLAIEEQFYLLLPLALLWSKKGWRFVPVAIGVIVICTVSRYVMALTGLADWQYTSLACFDALAIGVLSAQVAPLIPSKLSALLMIAGGVIMAVAAYPVEFNPPFSFLVVELGAAAFILGAQASENLFRHVWRIPSRVGQLSYEMYLLHPAVLFFIAPHMNRWPLTLGWLAFASITAIVAYLVHAVFTEPMNAWLRFALLKRREPDQEVLARIAYRSVPGA